MQISMSYALARKNMDPILEHDKHYTYKDLRIMMENLFPGINSNQVAGLIRRFSNGPTAIFTMIYQPGARAKYILMDKSVIAHNIIKDESVKDILLNSINRALFDIGNIRSGAIISLDEFNTVRDIESKLTAMVEDIKAKF